MLGVEKEGTRHGHPGLTPRASIKWNVASGV